MRAVLFDHIAIAVPRLADADAVLAAELGGRSTFGAATDEYRFWHWRYEGGGEDGFLHRFLAQHGPGIHHVTFTVPHLGEACDRARAHGYSIVGYDDSDPQWKEAFLHVEPPGATPGPGSRSPSIRVLGLRLSARSRADAHTQWGTVVRGERAADDDGALVYRWPGSFMHIAVEIDPHRDEGPLYIEYASRHPVALPDGAHPILGATFTRRSPG